METENDIKITMEGNKEVEVAGKEKAEDAKKAEVTDNEPTACPNNPDPEVRRLIPALRKNQLSILELEVEFHKGILKIEMEQEKRLNELFDERHGLISGTIDPSMVTEETTIEEDKAASDEQSSEMNQDFEVPIRNFWLDAFRNSSTLSKRCSPEDMKILRSLKDIRSEFVAEPIGYKLLFYFEPNDYFTNSVLTKTFEVQYDLNPEDPLGYEGPVVHNCKGCVIDWKPGRDVTKPQEEDGGTGASVTSPRRRSFFEFFNMLGRERGESESILGAGLRLQEDLNIGQFVKETLLPRAALYFTGEEESLDSDYFDPEEAESLGILTPQTIQDMIKAGAEYMKQEATKSTTKTE